MPTEPTETAEEREAHIEGLLAQMTVAEKASLTGGADVWHLPAVERLGIGQLKVSDGPSGVRGQRIGLRRSLSVPCGTAMGATWDVDLIGQVGAALGGEAQSKGVHVLLGPTVCIHRTPLAGRTFESFAEDPWLSSRLTVAYIKGVQAQGVGCCVKHFACNDQEHERMTISAEVDQRTLREIHLPSFEAAVHEAGTWSLMSAYNRINGTFCGEHPWLLGSLLKEEWGFDGVVISDWFGTHSTAEAANAGLDVEMPGRPSFLGPKLVAAVESGEVAENVLDEHVRRILRLADRTGLLAGPPSEIEDEDDDLSRRAVARAAAVGGTVLLRNEGGMLPLDADAPLKIAVVGPAADRFEAGGGGSAEVVSFRELSFVDELRDRLPGAEIVFERGCRIDKGIPPIDPRFIGEGMYLEYFAGLEWEGPVRATELSARARVVFEGRPQPDLRVQDFSVRGKATFRPDVSGTWTLAIANAGAARLLLDGDEIVDNTKPASGGFFFGLGSGMVGAPCDLVAGQDYELTVELAGIVGMPLAGFQLGASRPSDDGEMDRAVAAAADADVVIAVVGSNSQWETEGGDRPNLDLIGDQDELVRRVAAANPNTAVIVNAGAPMVLPWTDDVRSVLYAWYPGEEGAAALADIVAGLADPGGRLPLSFPKRIEDTAAFGWYPGANDQVTYGEGVFVGYRHFDARDVEPAFCFGHGLSFTTFGYGAPTVTVDQSAGTAVVTVDVTNTGDRDGSEVVQLYVGAVDPIVPRPVRELKAFAKVHLGVGETQTVRLTLDSRSFAHWDDTAEGWLVAPGPYDLSVGSSSRAIHHTARTQIEF